ncbi:hypothetical protein AVEN_29973-1, partial [Araneus ventricosus]
ILQINKFGNRKIRITPVNAVAPGILKGSDRYDSSSAEAGVLVAHHQATARPFPKDPRNIIGLGTLATVIVYNAGLWGSEFLLTYPVATHPLLAVPPPLRINKFGSFLLAILNGLSGIAIRFQFRGRRAPGSKPDSPEDLPCLMSPRWCDVEAWRGYQLRCRPCHQTTVQNDNVRPKSPRVSSELDVNVTKLNFRHFNLDEFIIGP